MPGISQTELARLLGCERATAGLQVADCERRGWIKRLPSPRDKRRYELHITPNGERMLAEVRKVIAQHEAGFLTPLSQEDRKTLRRVEGQIHRLLLPRIQAHATRFMSHPLDFRYCKVTLQKGQTRTSDDSGPRAAVV